MPKIPAEETKVTLESVVLSFPKLYEPDSSIEGGPKKFRANFLLDPESASGKANIKKIKTVKSRVEKAAFGDKKVRYKEGRNAVSKGEEHINQQTMEIYDGYEGMIVVRASNHRRPLLLNRDKTPTDQTDGLMYGGAIVDAIVSFYTTDSAKSGGVGFFATVEGVRFRAHGEAFGNAPLDPSAFADLEDDGDDWGGADDDDDGLPI